MKVGDKVKIDYISDCNPYNGKVGTVTWLHDYNYYPNRDYSVIEKKTQGIITYGDGTQMMIDDVYRKGCGVVSPVKVVNSYGESAEELWNEFGDVPMNPETECIEECWYGFPVGTHREDIWHWFEETFHVSVHNLMYSQDE